MLTTFARRALPHSVYRAIRKRRVARSISTYTPSQHTGNYGGHRLTLRFEDPLAEGWYGHDWEQPGEIALLRKIGALRPGARVFDLGAHQAVMALMLAAETGPNGHVVAVEAEPHNARVALVNCGLNSADNVEVVHAAAAGQDGIISFAEGLNGSIDAGTSIGNVTVPALTINTLCAQYGTPDIVMVDIEGYEGVALKASGDAIGATFAVEVHTDKLVDATVPDILERFAGWDMWVSETGEDFAPLDGTPAWGRFFLVAKPR